MSGLYRRSNVFADVRNMVVSYDTIVASRIPRYFNAFDGAKFFFLPTLEELSKLPYEQLVFKILAEKTQRNFLMDYFDWTKVEISQDDIDPINICNRVYWESLNLPVIEKDILSYMDISFLMTSVGKSFQILCTDTNLDSICLYLGEKVPQEITKGLTTFYNGSVKVHYLIGTPSQLKHSLQKKCFDSYFFEDSDDIDSLISREHPVLSEVLLPGNHVNLSIVDEIEGTKLRDIILKQPLEYYKEKLNLDIHTMNLPI